MAASCYFLIDSVQPLGPRYLEQEYHLPGCILCLCRSLKDEHTSLSAFVYVAHSNLVLSTATRFTCCRHMWHCAFGVCGDGGEGCAQLIRLGLPRGPQGRHACAQEVVLGGVEARHHSQQLLHVAILQLCAAEYCASTSLTSSMCTSCLLAQSSCMRVQG